MRHEHSVELDLIGSLANSVDWVLLAFCSTARDSTRFRFKYVSSATTISLRAMRCNSRSDMESVMTSVLLGIIRRSTPVNILQLRIFGLWDMKKDG